MLAYSFFIKLSSKLQVTRTGIKAWSSSVLGWIRPLILELLALEWRKFHTFELEYLWSQLFSLDQILCVASLGCGKGFIRFWGRLTWHIGLRWAMVALWATCSLPHQTSFLLYMCRFDEVSITQRCFHDVGIHPVWSESSLCTQWVAKDPSFLHAESEDWSVWVDAQADLSLCWAHMPFYWFCRETAQLLMCSLVIIGYCCHKMVVYFECFIYYKGFVSIKELHF